MNIGENHFPTKKAAVSFYRTILNSYEIGSNLTGDDLEATKNLLTLHLKAEKKIGIGIEHIRVGTTCFGKRGFEIVRNDGSTEFFSYLKIITGPTSSLTKFSKACRNAIQEDLHSVKRMYFEKHSKGGKSPCQETGQLHDWENLCVDHRQPNTLSVIIDRFIEVSDVNLKIVGYRYVDGGPDEFQDNALKQSFRDYHRKKATLRVVHRSLNSSRAFQGRVSRNTKDLAIPDQATTSSGREWSLARPSPAL
jgi:hypothetical protein